MQPVTRIPNGPAFIEGVTNLRGRVIPVLDLRKRFGLPASAPTRRSRIVVGELGQHTVGLVVDGVSEVLLVGSDAVEPPSTLVTSADSAFLRGVAKLDERLILLLDLSRHPDPVRAGRPGRLTGVLGAGFRVRRGPSRTPKHPNTRTRTPRSTDRSEENGGKDSDRRRRGLHAHALRQDAAVAWAHGCRGRERPRGRRQVQQREGGRRPAGHHDAGDGRPDRPQGDQEGSTRTRGWRWSRRSASSRS